MCLPDDPPEVRDAACKLQPADIGLLGYIAAGQDADMQAPSGPPPSEEQSADFLYTHERKYLENEAKRQKTHSGQSAVKRVDELLNPGMAVLPQRLPLIQKRKRGTANELNSYHLYTAC